MRERHPRGRATPKKHKKTTSGATFFRNSKKHRKRVPKSSNIAPKRDQNGTRNHQHADPEPWWCKSQSMRCARGAHGVRTDDARTWRKGPWGVRGVVLNSVKALNSLLARTPLSMHPIVAPTWGAPREKSPNKVKCWKKKGECWNKNEC